MSEKVSASEDASYTSHNEKELEKTDRGPEPELVEDTSVRRKSVALNIVENPLKVSFASSFAALTLTLFTLTAQLPRADRHQCTRLRRVAWHG